MYIFIVNHFNLIRRKIMKKIYVKAFFVFILILPYTINTGLANNSFPDLQDNHWAYQTIVWAVDSDIILGYPDGTIKPNQKVSEAEFLTMLLRAYGINFTSSIGHWTDEPYQHAKDLNYPLVGYDSYEIRNQHITRERVAEIISSTQGVNYNDDDAIKYLLIHGLASGKTGKMSVDSFMGKDNLTRAEAVTFIRNVLDYGISEKLLQRPMESSNSINLPVEPFSVDLYARQLDLALYDLGYKHYIDFSKTEKNTSLKIYKTSEMNGLMIWGEFNNEDVAGESSAVIWNFQTKEEEAKEIVYLMLQLYGVEPDGQLEKLLTDESFLNSSFEHKKDLIQGNFKLDVTSGENTNDIGIFIFKQ